MVREGRYMGEMVGEGGWGGTRMIEPERKIE